MIRQTFYNNDIAIVGYSCVLPGSQNPKQFWQNCIEQRSQVSSISEERLKRYLIFKKSELRERIYSDLACEIPTSRYLELLKKHKLERKEAHRLYTYIADAMDQVLQQVYGPAKEKPKDLRCDLILGCMNPDTDYELQVIRNSRQYYLDELTRELGQEDAAREQKIKEIVDYAVDDLSRNLLTQEHNGFTSFVLNDIAQKNGFNGEHFLVDAACASSLSALDVAAQRLRLYQTDLAISGGIESNLGYGAFIIFSTVGALAEKRTMPFDKKSEGLVQGEGVVTFAMKRIEDALRDKDNIYGVLRGVAGSSDGRSASLFQPNVEGQNFVYKKVHGDDRNLTYIEAHGTGTEVGDNTEMQSISAFFKGHSTPVGSSKALFGHTKGAAGAVGVLKALLIIKEKQIPGSNYVSESLFGDKASGNPYINSETLDVKSDDGPVKVGVNAFGFGGTNYHALVEEFLPGAEIKIKKQKPFEAPVLIAESTIALDDFTRDQFIKYDFPFRMPPKSVAAIDNVQLLALLTAWQCIHATGPVWKFVPKESVNVVSGCTLFLDQIYQIIHRLTYEIIEIVGERQLPEGSLKNDIKKLGKSSFKDSLPPINEDAATGLLNNVIAGRVCNAFDLYGKSYNIDKDIASVAVTLQTIQNDLALNPNQIFLVIGANEDYDRENQKPKRTSVTTRLITSRQFAIENELKPVSQIQMKSESVTL